MRRRDERTQVFDGLAFFEGCDRRLLVEMAPHADRVWVRAGTVLAVEGQHARQLVVLLQGTVRTAGGDRIGTLGIGQAIAPHAAADFSPFPATVTALSEVEILVVNGPAFARAARQHPALAPPVPAAPIRIGAAA